MTASSPSPEPVLVPLLLGLTVVTGLVDAVSYLALGHVFTANMTGNVVFLGTWCSWDSLPPAGGGCPRRDRERQSWRFSSVP